MANEKIAVLKGKAFLYETVELTGYDVNSIQYVVMQESIDFASDNVVGFTCTKHTDSTVTLTGIAWFRRDAHGALTDELVDSFTDDPSLEPGALLAENICRHLGWDTPSDLDTPEGIWSFIKTVVVDRHPHDLYPVYAEMLYWGYVADVLMTIYDTICLEAPSENFQLDSL